MMLLQRPLLLRRLRKAWSAKGLFSPHLSVTDISSDSRRCCKLSVKENSTGRKWIRH
jgi:hypothetical protein